MTISNTLSSAPVGRGWHIGLWIAQILLAAFFGLAGFMHATMSPAALAAGGVAWAENAPVMLIRFIGVSELAGVLGIILPALTRIQPGLTPLAALGFIAIQALAMPLHVYRGEFGVLPVNLVVIALAAFVLWGRNRKAVIAPRS